MLIRSSLAFALAISLAAGLEGSSEHNEDKLFNPSYSLPDLFEINSIPSEWQSIGSARLEEGRIQLTPFQSSVGSIWSKQAYEIKDSFTIEWTFRSVGFSGKSESGIAFWLTDSEHKADDALFGGPSAFDGLQILIDSNGPLGSSARGILNDGSNKLSEASIYDQAFASCLLAYQDTSIPTTIRLSYDRADNNLLKLQIDNRVCFQTRKVLLPSNAKYRLGATARNDKNKESFELLKLSTYDGMTKASSFPNTNPMEQPKLVTKIINKDTGKEELVETDLMKMKGLAGKIDNYEIYKKLDRIEGKILANDIGDINSILQALLEAQQRNERKMEILTSSMEVLFVALGKESDNPTESFKDFISMNEKLEKLLIDQQKIREHTKQNLENSGHGLNIDEVVRRLMFWIVSLIVLMLIVAYYTFRIRQDIVKVKLL